MSATDAEIRMQLVELGFLSASSPIAAGDSLFDANVLDSLRLMELVARLEARFGIRVGQDDLIPENFTSIADVTRYVNQRL